MPLLRQWRTSSFFPSPKHSTRWSEIPKTSHFSPFHSIRISNRCFLILQRIHEWKCLRHSFSCINIVEIDLILWIGNGHSIHNCLCLSFYWMWTTQSTALNCISFRSPEVNKNMSTKLINELLHWMLFPHRCDALEDIVVEYSPSSNSYILTSISVGCWWRSHFEFTTLPSTVCSRTFHRIEFIQTARFRMNPPRNEDQEMTHIAFIWEKIWKLSRIIRNKNNTNTFFTIKWMVFLTPPRESTHTRIATIENHHLSVLSKFNHRFLIEWTISCCSVISHILCFDKVLHCISSPQLPRE